MVHFSQSNVYQVKYYDVEKCAEACSNMNYCTHFLVGKSNRYCYISKNPSYIENRDCVEGATNTIADAYMFHRSAQRCSEQVANGGICTTHCKKQDIYYDITNADGYARCNGVTGQFEDVQQCVPRKVCSQDLTQYFDQNNVSSVLDVSIVLLEEGKYCYNPLMSDYYSGSSEFWACAQNCLADVQCNHISFRKNVRCYRNRQSDAMCNRWRSNTEHSLQSHSYNYYGLQNDVKGCANGTLVGGICKQACLDDVYYIAVNGTGEQTCTEGGWTGEPLVCGPVLTCEDNLQASAASRNVTTTSGRLRRRHAPHFRKDRSLAWHQVHAILF